MSLRGRLTLLYTALVGGILLFFGMAVYAAISFTLTRQIDQTLRQTANTILAGTTVGAIGQTSFLSLPPLELPTDVYVQLWDPDGGLIAQSPNLGASSSALDEIILLRAEQPVYRDTRIGAAHFRVLTIPLTAGMRSVGVLQVGAKLALVEAVQRALTIVLALGVISAISISAVAGYLSTRQALAPLEDVTETALNITRADDLSRRIPYQGPPDDEVGQLIEAFNQTLGRLENLFNTQRRFMADVGHELRTPLTVIRGNVDLMRRMGGYDEESLCSIESEVDRLTRMVGDLLLLAQAESGNIPLHKQIVELDTLTLEALNQMRILAREKLSLRLGEIDQVLICADPDRIKQVLLNLIGNAINYTPPGGEVVVGLGKVGSEGRLTVSDTGPGIPPEDLPHIFERFYRGEKARTRSRDGKGFGLGLSIAYWIVRNHGGRLEVESQVGRGATFSVWLPLSDGECKTP